MAEERRKHNSRVEIAQWLRWASAIGIVIAGFAWTNRQIESGSYRFTSLDMQTWVLRMKIANPELVVVEPSEIVARRNQMRTVSSGE